MKHISQETIIKLIILQLIRRGPIKEQPVKIERNLSTQCLDRLNAFSQVIDKERNIFYQKKAII